VIVRVLGNAAEDQLDVPETRTFIGTDGTLDMRRLLEEFAAFWREHGEILAGKMTYHEVAPQLVLMAYLRRVVNGGGFIDREYGVGRGRIDLLVRWPLVGAANQRAVQREALELKAWAQDRPDPLRQGLQQLEACLSQLGLDHGTLVIFDRRPNAPPASERTRWAAARTASGRDVSVLRA
jgi:hypothetical protein